MRNHFIRILSGFFILSNVILFTTNSYANPLYIPEDPSKLGAELYVYAYPLVLMDVTKTVLTNVGVVSNTKAPINQFLNMKTFPNASFTDVVRPNADTLYSSAWLDLSEEPIILQVPQTDHYYLMPMLDAYTNVFASPGTRTTRNGKQNFAIVGPAWSGTLPEGMTEIKAPTNTVWILGRTQTNGQEDYAAVQAIQKKYLLIPLRAWPPAAKNEDHQTTDASPINPNIDMKTAPSEQVAKMGAETFFTRFAALLKNNPPNANDASIIQKLKTFGISMDEEFDFNKLDPAKKEALEEGMVSARNEIKKIPTDGVTDANKWLMIVRDIGNYDTNYLQRARIAYMGLGANLPQDAIYPSTTQDGEGNTLNGGHRYVLHFNKDDLPPVNAFWSVTLYNAKQLFADNPLNRYAIGDRDKLTYNKDGSLDIYIQHNSPGAEKESNWLPAPKDDFSLTVRLYWPKDKVLNGNWAPPMVKKL